MNWNEILEKYLKAYHKCELWAHENVMTSTIPPTMEEINIRKLYDFFDENEIWIEISAQSINKWAYDIFKLTNDNFLMICDDYAPYLNRNKAEEAAFTKAFELLNNKL